MLLEKTVRSMLPWTDWSAGSVNGVCECSVAATVLQDDARKNNMVTTRIWLRTGTLLAVMDTMWATSAVGLHFLGAKR